jgi:cellulose synthase/poly-beta-1,6-N-acetylglucosamine synthase-like glycosyltransferase
MSGATAKAERWPEQARGERRRQAVSRPSPARDSFTAEELPVELAAFEGVLDPAVLDAAARRADRLGVGGDEVLRCAGILSPEQIASEIAYSLDIAVDPLTRPFAPRALEAACAGVLLRRERDGSVFTVAARGTGIRWLAARIAEDPDARDGLRIAAPELLGEHVRDVAAEELAREAVHGLRDRRPDLSALAYGWSPLRALGLSATAGGLAATYLFPAATLIAAEYFLAFCFITWTVLRLAACASPRPEKVSLDLSDRQLPIYTIIVPLYREAPVAAKLVEALKRLRYPREKLDIKLVLERDDFETREAVARLKLHAPFEVIAPPTIGPQTKPRALAAALPFARGSFVTIYDAEDEPEPEQLRDALAAYLQGPENLACVQAKLAIDNPRDSWFSRQFAAEYAGQFDIFLPLLARFRLPIPLGGTSNHFRTDILRKVGGWDPYNVTEDADLGMRLARYGYRTGVVDSTTWEEAPVGRRQWIGQRTRWMKGWLQTWLVHMRHPVRLWREMGAKGFFALQILIGASLLSALVHPFFMLLVATDAWTGELFAAGDTLEHSVRKALALVVLCVGYLGTVALGFAGLRRRKMMSMSWVLFTVPAYWMFLSWAAWRALWQLLRAPYKWEKTEHGLARSSLRTQPARPLPTMRPVREFAAERLGRTGTAR